MKSKSITLDYEINENGCPVIAAPERAYATARFANAGPDAPLGEIAIEANRRGLIALARWMVALAAEDAYLDHQHFDNEVNFGLFKSDTNCELIIQRVGR